MTLVTVGLAGGCQTSAPEVRRIKGDRQGPAPEAKGPAAGKDDGQPKDDGTNDQTTGVFVGNGDGPYDLIATELAEKAALLEFFAKLAVPEPKLTNLMTAAVTGTQLGIFRAVYQDDPKKLHGCLLDLGDKDEVAALFNAKDNAIVLCRRYYGTPDGKASMPTFRLKVLLHELMHLVFSQTEHDSTPTAEEQAIKLMEVYFGDMLNAADTKTFETAAAKLRQALASHLPAYQSAKDLTEVQVEALYWENAPEVAAYRELLKDPLYAEYTQGALFYLQLKKTDDFQTFADYFDVFLPQASQKLQLTRSGEGAVVGVAKNIGSSDGLVALQIYPEELAKMKAGVAYTLQAMPDEAGHQHHWHVPANLTVQRDGTEQ